MSVTRLAAQTHRVALLGFGTVGKGFAEIVVKKQEFMKAKYNLNVDIVAVCDQHKGMVYNPDGLNVPELLKYDAEATANDDSKNCLAGFGSGAGFSYDWDPLRTCAEVDADSLCELTFTNLTDGMPGIDHCRTALNSGKNVITTNKGPCVFAYDELTELAESKGKRFMIEGAIVSGTPIVSLMRTLPGCSYTEISGILNGTCNYILTSMEEQGCSFEEALDNAQNLGYAEADPTGDVGGGDARAKAIILMRLLGDKFNTDQIELEGITGITSEMIESAKSQGKRWKLVSKLTMDEASGKVVSCSVKPEMLDLSHPLAGVGGALNALNFSTDMLGNDLCMIGPGAGKIETGYSLFSDMLYLCGGQQ